MPVNQVRCESGAGADADCRCYSGSEGFSKLSSIQHDPPERLLRPDVYSSADETAREWLCQPRDEQQGC